MSTTKSTKKPGGKKGALKKGSSKKGSGKGKRPHPFDGDPPIIVGGGGSTLIWVRQPYTLTPFNGAPPPPPDGSTAAYSVYVVNTDVTYVAVHRTRRGKRHPHNLDDNTHHSEFFS